MHNEQQVMIGKPYRYSIWQRLAIIPAVLVSIVAAVVLFRVELPWIGLLMLPFLLAAVILPGLMVSYSITLHPEEIRVAHLMREQGLRWSEIGGFRPMAMGMAGYTLYDHNQRISLRIDPQVVDFPQVNEYIRERLPQLWSDHYTKTFSFNKALAIGYLLAVVMILSIGAWVFLNESLIGPFFVLIALLLGVQLVIPLFQSYLSLSISGRSLHLQPILGSAKTISVDEIEAISLQPRYFGLRSRRGVEYAVMLTLKNAANIKISNLEVGPAVLVNLLRSWWLGQRAWRN